MLNYTFCPICGNRVDRWERVCPYCRYALDPSAVTPAPVEVEGDAPNPGFALLGFLIPIVGVILHLSIKDRYPRRARSARNGAIYGVFIYIIIGAIYSALNA